MLEDGSEEQALKKLLNSKKNVENVGVKIIDRMQE